MEIASRKIEEKGGEYWNESKKRGFGMVERILNYEPRICNGRNLARILPGILNVSDEDFRYDVQKIERYEETVYRYFSSGGNVYFAFCAARSFSLSRDTTYRY